ncbi:MAG: NYN domain-containing protein [Planctomycetota bacterium]
MSLLIDGYNLLAAVGIVGRGVGPGGLERSRRALLNFLAESLDLAEIARTTVVFDAADAPPGLPRVVEHRGLTVRFSAGYEDADTLIEELIRAESAPRRLTVVSSDHRLQRAARRRRARAVDSDVWYAQTVRQRRDRRQSSPTPPAKPHVPLLEEDVARWLEQFGGESQLEKFIEEVEADQARPVKEPTPDELPADHPATDKPTDEEAAELQLQNPFPPGYGEDLLDDESPDNWLDPFPPGYGDDIGEC